MSNIGGTLEIEKDGLYFCITYANAATQYTVEALLEEAEGVWMLTDTTRGHTDKTSFSQRIGRRQKWQDALASALIIMEAESRARA
jgi:hypothetical protein